MALLDNIFGYWKLDGNSNDSVAINNGTDTSIVYSSGNGKINQGAGFAGSSFITLSSTAPQTGSGAFSIQCWFKTTTSANAVFVHFGSANTNQSVQFGIGTTKLQGNFYGGGGVVTSAADVNDGVFHHGFLTFNGSVIKIYLDGNLVGTSGSITPNIVSSLNRIGARDGGSDAFIGAIDEVGMWSRELSIAEIKSLYAGGNGIQYNFNLAISVFDSISITESISLTNTASSINLSIFDSISITEFISFRGQSMVSVVDSISISESVLVVYVMYASVFDSVSMSEFITDVETTTPLISVTNSVSISEFVMVSLYNIISVYDSISISDIGISTDSIIYGSSMYAPVGDIIT